MEPTPSPSRQDRSIVHLLLLLVATLGLILLMRGSIAIARSTFQTPIDTPVTQPTATPVLAVTDTPVPQPTDTPVPPAADTPTPPPTDEGPDLPTPSDTPPPQGETPVATPTSQASPTTGPTAAPPTDTPPAQPSPATAAPTLVPAQTSTQQPAAPQSQEPETLTAPKPTPSGTSATELAVLIDSLVVTFGYAWLCCGVLFVLFIPVVLLWLNRRGKRRLRGL